MSLHDQITSDMKAAMKAQDAARLSTLRLIRAALLNLAKSGKGDKISDDDVLKTLNTLLKQRRDAMEQYEKAARPDLAAKERAEADIITGYLPQAATPEEIEQAVNAALSVMGATSIKQMGAVMKVTMANLAGRSADGRAVSAAVKAKLTGV